MKEIPLGQTLQTYSLSFRMHIYIYTHEQVRGIYAVRSAASHTLIASTQHRSAQRKRCTENHPRMSRETRVLQIERLKHLHTLVAGFLQVFEPDTLGGANTEEHRSDKRGLGLLLEYQLQSVASNNRKTCVCLLAVWLGRRPTAS